MFLTLIAEMVSFDVPHVLLKPTVQIRKQQKKYLWLIMTTSFSEAKTCFMISILATVKDRKKFI